MGVNRKARDEIGFATSNRAMKPNNVPMNEYMMAYDSAWYDCPRFAKGKPSRVVTTDEGAPGILIRIAESAPEKTPTTYTPMMVASASVVCHE
ncbi:hypothetical protein SDC9_57805 [bioreactor metagenome]|uniref:Uncharacterized protein n=1 Tax=bioreactor metagenome TaxID=1076179 RepID=A0A644X5V4_9ZZZZ